MLDLSDWYIFIQDKLEISIYLSLDKYKQMNKVNTILYFVFHIFKVLGVHMLH